MATALRLIRNEFLPDGIFGVLQDESGNPLAVTLEHSYLLEDGSYAPKVGVGTYVCQRGMHQLAHMTLPFETFEITNVPDHTNILFHVGNYNQDSEGCVLLGQKMIQESSGIHMITNSKIAFSEFMEHMEGLDQFTLEVSDE